MDICTTLGIHIKPHVKHSSLIFGTVVGLSHSHMGHMGVSAAISPLLTQVFNPYAGHPEHWLPTGWATHPNNDNISWIGKPNSVWSDVDLENRNNIPTDNQFDPSSHGKIKPCLKPPNISQHLSGTGMDTTFAIQIQIGVCAPSAHILPGLTTAETCHEWKSVVFTEAQVW